MIWVGVQVLGRCRSLAKLSLAACQLGGACEELQGLSSLRWVTEQDHSFVLPSWLGPGVQGSVWC